MLKREQLPQDQRALQDWMLALDQRVEYLAQQLEWLKRRLYGPRSEKRADPSQGLLPFADLPAAPTAPEALQRGAVVPAGETKPRGHGRRKLPPHLHRERVEYHPPEAQAPCPGCGGKLAQIGEEVSEQIESIPATVFVVEHARIKYACPHCGDGVRIGQAPSKSLERGLAGPGLLADLCHDKADVLGSESAELAQIAKAAQASANHTRELYRQLRRLNRGHHDVKLGDEGYRRVTAWSDMNALFCGSYEKEEREKELRGEPIPMPELQ